MTTGSDKHQSFYSLKQLANAGLRNKSETFSLPSKTKPWTKSIAKEPPTVSYDEVMESDSGVKEWLLRVKEYGFCYVDGCPPTPEATEELLERIAFIRVTHYGMNTQTSCDFSNLKRVQAVSGTSLPI